MLLTLFAGVGMLRAQDGAVRENLGPTVNSAAVELLPVIAPDGSRLYFDRKYDSANVGGADDPDDIWVSALQSDGSWGPARNLGSPLNSTGSDVLYWISSDGSSALIYSDALVARGGLGLGIAEHDTSGWHTPRPITVDGVTSLGEYYYAFISPDERRLLLAYAPDSSKPENLDLFVAERSGTDPYAWRRPRPLDALNTPKYDAAPMLAPDNRTLYFLSDGQRGLGGTDLYMSRRTPGSWFAWSKPVNLGAVINTMGSEASAAVDAAGEWIYVSGSSHGGSSYGASDIYRLKLPDSLRPLPSVLVRGQLVGPSGGVRGLVRAEHDGSEVASTASDSSGRFLMVLSPGAEYHLTGWADGFEETDANVNLGPDSGEIELTLRLVGEGEIVDASGDHAPPPTVVEQVAFSSGSATVGRSGERTLKRVVAAYRRIPGSYLRRVELVGHTDAIGDSLTNLRLSRERVQSVRRWLESHGIESGAVIERALGEREPVASNSTPSGRARNRRVDIVVRASPRSRSPEQGG